MKTEKFNIAFFGSSLVSAYWNGAATYYRGLVKAFHELGHEVTFYEPDALNRQKHRDMPNPDWANVVVYEASKRALYDQLRAAKNADIIVKASGVGIFDDLLEELVIEHRKPGQLCLFWDVDAPATLSTIRSDSDHHMHRLLPEYDAVFTYGGGDPVVDQYKALGAKNCVPIYNACDRETHFPCEPDPKFEGDLSFLGNRLPDREARVDEFFFNAARNAPDSKFIIGGSGWGDKEMPENVEFLGHVYTTDHNAFNCTPKAVLNISRESMASNGFSPATRVFEAAGAGACVITDFWEGIDQFFEPNKEILVARNGEEVGSILQSLTRERARKIGRAAHDRVMKEHTYHHRAKTAVAELQKMMNAKAQIAL